MSGFLRSWITPGILDLLENSWNLEAPGKTPEIFRLLENVLEFGGSWHIDNGHFDHYRSLLHYISQYAPNAPRIVIDFQKISRGYTPGPPFYAVTHDCKAPRPFANHFFLLQLSIFKRLGDHWPTSSFMVLHNAFKLLLADKLKKECGEFALHELQNSQ